MGSGREAGFAVPGLTGIQMVLFECGSFDKVGDWRKEATAIPPEYHAKPQHVGSAVYAVYPYIRNVSAKVHAFIDFIAKKSKTEPDFQMADGDRPIRMKTGFLYTRTAPSYQELACGRNCCHR